MTKEELKVQQEELKLEKKRMRLEKKTKRREKREQNPGILKKNYLEMKYKYQSVRQMYKDMNRQIKSGEIEMPQEELFADEAEDVSAKKLRHSGGKFVITVHPKAADYFVFLMMHELGTTAGVASLVINLLALILLIISIISGVSGTTIILIAVVLLSLVLVGPGAMYIRARDLTKSVNSTGHSRTYCLSGAGFDISGENAGYTSYKWDKVEQVLESRKNYYFYLVNDEGFVIPKADVSAGGRKPEQLTAVLTGKVGTHYRKLILRNRKS